ncbi:MAG: hypothetical protein WBI07_09065 [Mobilitalea sp.]
MNVKILISDIGLPGMSGYEIAEAFQNNDQLTLQCNLNIFYPLPPLSLPRASSKISLV